MSYKLRTVKPESYKEMYGEDTKMLPSFSLDENELPEIKGWTVGKKYMLEMEVEMVSSSKNEYGETGLEGRFKIHKVGAEEEDEATKQAKRGHY